MTRKELGILFTLAAVQFTHILDAMILMPMAPSIRKAFEISTQEFGFLVASYSLAAFVSAIAATFWVDRFDRKRVLVFLYIGFVVGTFACSLAPNFWGFLIARTFTGFFGGIASAVIQSIVGDLIAPERRAQGMGILMTWFSLASVGGIPLGIALGELVSWQAPFLFICAVALPIMFCIYMVIPPVNAHLQNAQATSQKGSIYRSILQNRLQQMAILVALLSVWAHSAIIPFISDYLVNNLHFEMKSEILLMYVVGGALTTICSPLIGKIADKTGRYLVYVVLSLSSIVPIFLMSNLGEHSLALLLLVGGMFFVFSGGRFIPSSAMVTSTVEPALRGRFMSLVSAVQQLGMGLSTLIGGLIIVNGANGHLEHYPTVGYIGIALSLLGVAAAWSLKGK